MEIEQHECNKDAIIEQLSNEKETLVMNIRDARNVNLRMQVQLIELLSGKKLNVNLPDKLNPTLVEVDCREEEDMIVYGECIVLSKEEDEFLKALNQPENDRKYVKTLLEKFFNRIYFQIKSAEGYSTGTIVKAIESTNVYFVARQMYRNRVIESNIGDIPQRFKIFDDVIYKKADYNVRQRLPKPTSE